MDFKKIKIIYIFVALLLTISLPWFWRFGFASIAGGIDNSGKLKVIFFDVGQGSSVFIEALNKNQILIDGGPGSQILNKLGGVMPFFDRDIDAVILTHPDSDHLNGLVDVLQKYEVGQVIDSCVNDSGAAYQEWLKLIADKKINRLCAKAGQKIKLDSETEINILYPFSSLEGMSFKNTNDVSIVAKLNYGQNHILLTGDAEEKTEYQLINFGVIPQAQILQVGHHGSKSSSSENFVKAVNPETAVIQVGKNNRYGHPHQEVLGRLNSFCHSDPPQAGKNLNDEILRFAQDDDEGCIGERGAEIFRTDLDGDIEFLCDVSQCLAQ
jgi:competence protein ComEC